MKHTLKQFISWFAFVILFSCFFKFSFSQSFLVHRYSEIEGLPSTIVYDITQDHQGRMWFATRAGIAVYDGVSWGKFTISDGLPVSSFSYIAIDRKGRVWALASPGQGGILVTYYDGVQWNSIPGPGREDFELSEITSFALSDQDENPEMPILAVGIADQGVAIRVRGKWKHLTQDQGLLSNTVNGLALLDRKFYVATAKGLSVIDLDLFVDNRLNEKMDLVSTNIKGITVQYKNKFPCFPGISSRIWLYTENWIGWFDEMYHNITRYPHKMSLSGREPIVKMLPDYCSGIYVGDFYILNYFNYNTGSWQLLDAPNGLIGGGSNSLFIDFEKNIWIACQRGVSKISNRQFANFQRTHGLLEDEVTAVLEYEPGRFALGHNYGVTLYDGERFRQVPFSWEEESTLPVCRVLDMQIDSKKNIWLAASWAGLARINPRMPRQVSWFGPAHGLDKKILCLWIDKMTDQIWVGTANGIFLYTGKDTGKKDQPEFVLINIGKFPGQNYRRIYGESGKLRYLAGHNSGVFIYDEQNNLWKNYVVPGDRKANSIYSIKKDSSGRLFIGTLGGLYFLENEILKKFEYNGFEVDRPVYSILEDQKKRLWFGTDNGVVRWDGKNVDTYSMGEGLIGQETNRSAAITDTRGRTWIGTNRGVSIYDEAFDDRKHYNPPPRLQLLHIRVSGKQYPLSPNQPIQLAYQDNEIEFYFKGISFSDEAAIRFKNKLEGFEKEWSREHYPYQQMIRYLNLPPGAYRFHIKARNALGVWSDVVVSPKITIRKPFYNTWWFFLLAVVLVGAVSYSIFLYFSNKRHAAILEKQVQERTDQLLVVEQQLIQAQKMEAIGTLAGGIAHDFNNILAVIMGQAELLRDDLPPDSEMQKKAEHIVTASDRGAELVRRILLFSRQNRREQKPIHLNAIIKDSLTLLRSILPATIEIHRDIRAGSRRVLADATQIRQIMMNFGTNAAHAMREQGGILEVSLEEIFLDAKTVTTYNNIKAGPYLLLTVSDTGHGMSPEVMKRIFDPYFTTKKTGEGTGMGLAVIHGIVKSSGGDITVHSAIGKGTTFKILLPCIVETKKQKTGSKINISEEVPGGTERILLIDDETTLTQSNKNILEKLGYHVMGMSNAAEALETFKNNPHRFDLIISDMTMPHMTGIQLAREIKHIRPDIPIILISGYGSEMNLQQINASGVNEFITKPVARNKLARTVRQVLDCKQ